MFSQKINRPVTPAPLPFRPLALAPCVTSDAGPGTEAGPTPGLKTEPNTLVRPRLYRPRGGRTASTGPSTAAAGTLSGRVTKPPSRKKAIKPREQKALVELHDDMTPAERQEAKKVNNTVRNGDAAARSRLRRQLTLLERDASAAGFERNSALLSEMLSACEGLLPPDERAVWGVTRGVILARHGHDSGASLEVVLYRRDEAVQPQLARVGDVWGELEMRVDSGEIVLLHGLDLATAASRIMGRPLGCFDEHQLRVRKDDFLARLEGAAQAAEDSRRAIVALQEKVGVQREKLDRITADLPSFRATAAEFGLEGEYSRLFPDELQEQPVPDGLPAGVDPGLPVETVDPADLKMPVELDSGGVVAPVELEAARVLLEPEFFAESLPDELIAAALQAEGYGFDMDRSVLDMGDHGGVYYGAPQFAYRWDAPLEENIHGAVDMAPGEYPAGPLV